MQYHRKEIQRQSGQTRILAMVEQIADHDDQQVAGSDMQPEYAARRPVAVATRIPLAPTALQRSLGTVEHRQTEHRQSIDRALGHHRIETGRAAESADMRAELGQHVQKYISDRHPTGEAEPTAARVAVEES